MQAIVRTSPLGLAALAAPALADIPFTTDDPGTLAAGEYEILAYSDGTITSMDFEGEAGIDVSVGIADNFQLGVTVPVANFGPQLETDRFAIGDTTIQAKIGLIAGEPGQVSLAIAPTLAPGGWRAREGARRASTCRSGSGPISETGRFMVGEAIPSRATKMGAICPLSAPSSASG